MRVEQTQAVGTEQTDLCLAHNFAISTCIRVPCDPTSPKPAVSTTMALVPMRMESLTASTRRRGGKSDQSQIDGAAVVGDGGIARDVQNRLRRRVHGDDLSGEAAPGEIGQHLKTHLARRPGGADDGERLWMKQEVQHIGESMKTTGGRLLWKPRTEPA